MSYDASFLPALGNPFGGTEPRWAAALPTARTMKSEPYSIKGCSPVRHSVPSIKWITCHRFRCFCCVFQCFGFTLCIESVFLTIKVLNASEFVRNKNKTKQKNNVNTHRFPRLPSWPNRSIRSLKWQMCIILKNWQIYIVEDRNPAVDRKGSTLSTSKTAHKCKILKAGILWCCPISIS